MTPDAPADCDSRTQFRIQVGHRPRALVCLPHHAIGHCLKTVPFFVSSTWTPEEGS